jgi:stage IV sporulation protein FB
MSRYEAPSNGDETAPISGADVAKFHIGPIPVRIEFPFFLVTVLLGFNSHRSATLLLTWVVVVLSSVLLHELGHAVLGRAFGSPTSIVLHGMGGLTFQNGGRFLSAHQDIMTSLAGSLSQIILLGIPAYFVVHSNSITSYGWYVFFWDLAWVSLGWGIINLLPILPLDGGNIAITLLRCTRGVIEPDCVARLLSVGTALGLANWAYHSLGWMAALWALLLAVWNAAALTKTGV